MPTFIVLNSLSSQRHSTLSILLLDVDQDRVLVAQPRPSPCEYDTSLRANLRRLD
jgi:hypothetical protein